MFIGSRRFELYWEVWRDSSWSVRASRRRVKVLREIDLVLARTKVWIADYRNDGRRWRPDVIAVLCAGRFILANWKCICKSMCTKHTHTHTHTHTQ